MRYGSVQGISGCASQRLRWSTVGVMKLSRAQSSCIDFSPSARYAIARTSAAKSATTTPIGHRRRHQPPATSFEALLDRARRLSA